MNLIGKNLEQNDCVIVALHNALQWTNRNDHYLGIYNIAKSKKWFEESEGVKIENLNFLFSHFELKAKELCGMSFSSLRRKLYKGKAILLAYIPKDRKDGHMVMLVKNKKEINIINPDYKLDKWSKLWEQLNRGKVTAVAWELYK